MTKSTQIPALAEWPENPSRPGFPQSPCTRICTLDETDTCLGCQRRLDEIVGWAGMSAAQQYAVIGQLAARREARAAAERSRAGLRTIPGPEVDDGQT